MTYPMAGALCSYLPLSIIASPVILGTSETAVMILRRPPLRYVGNRRYGTSETAVPYDYIVRRMRAQTY